MRPDLMCHVEDGFSCRLYVLSLDEAAAIFPLNLDR